jgi:hypothetical protein
MDVTALRRRQELHQQMTRSLELLMYAKYLNFMSEFSRKLVAENQLDSIAVENGLVRKTIELICAISEDRAATVDPSALLAEWSAYSGSHQLAMTHTEIFLHCMSWDLSQTLPGKSRRAGDVAADIIFDIDVRLAEDEPGAVQVSYISQIEESPL